MEIRSISLSEGFWRSDSGIDFFVFEPEVSLENLLFFQMPVLRFIVYSYFNTEEQTKVTVPGGHVFFVHRGYEDAGKEDAV
ncbi:hypothetical protein AALA13_14305 [Lachnospiraceae bacterium 50-23]|jgi:hypothetical protein|nr:hypothetical protein [Dorea sp.]